MSLKEDQQLKQEQDFLLKQFDDLFRLREGSIQSMGSIFNAYTTILTIIVAGIGLFIKGIEVNWKTDRSWIALACIGLALFAYGCYIHHQLIITYINQTVYTKKINLTRRYLTPEGMKKNRILLPDNAGKLKFGKQGYLEEDFSKVGVVSFIRWANSVILFLTTTLIFYKLFPVWKLICPPPCYWSVMKSLFFGIVFGVISYSFHKEHYTRKIDITFQKWEEEDLLDFDHIPEDFEDFSDTVILKNHVKR